ncbi:MAG: GIY-YIG nuclease family protein [Planctomycetota bacterium]|jgi:predicted GIY-YIG superfamily endonuclease
MWHVYILQCSDGSFHAGHTNDIEARIERHNNGKASKWTHSRLPVRLVYEEDYAYEAVTVRRQTQIKRWSRAKKQALIQGDFTLLKNLSKSRDQPFLSYPVQVELELPKTGKSC